MKSRLAASISVLFSEMFPGISRRYVQEAISSRSIIYLSGLSHSPTHNSFRSQKFERSSRAEQCSDIEDEAFSELGPETPECFAKPIKLVTEKVDPFLGYTSKRVLLRRSHSSDTRPNIKDIIATVGTASPSSKDKLGDPRHVSIIDTERKSDTESQHSVTIKNIPSKACLAEIIKGLSVFGKVSGASFVNESNRSKCCITKFENEESSRKAILAGKIIVRGRVFSIHHPDPPEVITVKIKNINRMTSDHVIHARCKHAGVFVGLGRKSKDVVDVYFNASNQITPLTILERLNNTVVDQSRWSACLETSKSMSSEALAEEERRGDLGAQISSQLNKLKNQLDLKKLYWQDLMNLHAGIMHLEDLPSGAEVSDNT